MTSLGGHVDTLVTRLILWGAMGFFAQFIDGTLGMGYGATLATMLIASGVLPVVASGSIHVAKIVSSFVSGGSHLWFGNVKKEWLLPLIVPGIIGGFCGAYLLTSIPGETIRPFIAGFLMCLGILIVYRFVRRKKAPTGITQNNGSTSKFSRYSLKLPALGFVAAAMDAIGGGGWGPIATPGLILTEDTEPSKVVGTVNLAEFFIAIAISVTLIVKIGYQSFDWPLVGVMMGGGVVAAPVAAFLCKKLPSRVLSIFIGLLLIALNLHTLLISVLQ
jgi:uncharacterized membrane protein YfcA